MKLFNYTTRRGWRDRAIFWKKQCDTAQAHSATMEQTAFKQQCEITELKALLKGSKDERTDSAGPS